MSDRIIERLRETGLQVGIDAAALILKLRDDLGNEQVEAHENWEMVIKLTGELDAAREYIKELEEHGEVKR